MNLRIVFVCAAVAGLLVGAITWAIGDNCAVRGYTPLPSKGVGSLTYCKVPK
jgi:hypothetical protein